MPEGLALGAGVNDGALVEVAPPFEDFPHPNAYSAAPPAFEDGSSDYSDASVLPRVFWLWSKTILPARFGTLHSIVRSFGWSWSMNWTTAWVAARISS